MEKMNNMQQNKINDDELDQVGGGLSFGVFTTEFKQIFDGTEMQEQPIEEEDNHYFGVRTLEMRVKPKKTPGTDDRELIKL